MVDASYRGATLYGAGTPTTWIGQLQSSWSTGYSVGLWQFPTGSSFGHTTYGNFFIVPDPSSLQYISIGNGNFSAYTSYFTNYSAAVGTGKVSVYPGTPTDKDSLVTAADFNAPARLTTAEIKAMIRGLYTQKTTEIMQFAAHLAAMEVRLRAYTYDDDQRTGNGY